MQSDIIDAILSSKLQDQAITITTTAINLYNEQCSNSLAIILDNIREYLIRIDMTNIFNVVGPVFFSSIFGVRFGFNLINKMRIKYVEKFSIIIVLKYIYLIQFRDGYNMFLMRSSVNFLL